jgi:hypothetical protein
MSRDRQRVSLEEGLSLDLNKLARDHLVERGARFDDRALRWVRPQWGETASGHVKAIPPVVDAGDNLTYRPPSAQMDRFDSTRGDLQFRTGEATFHIGPEGAPSGNRGCSFFTEREGSLARHIASAQVGPTPDPRHCRSRLTASAPIDLGTRPKSGGVSFLFQTPTLSPTQERTDGR